MKLAVYGQYYQNTYNEVIEQLLHFSENQKVHLIFEEKFYKKIIHLLNSDFQTFKNREELGNDTTVFVSIGGDGTILRAATFVKDSGIPILGINVGRLGFLASIPKESIKEHLDRVLRGEFSLSKRTVLGLQTSIACPELDEIDFALNEISINRKDTTSMITIETYLNNEYLNSYWADGLIISTPTGSTGYSLSCGGAVLFPEAKGLIITPIAPHNLNVRPIVIAEDTKIRLRVSGREKYYLVSLDSRIITMSNQTELVVQKKPFDINMVSFEDKSFIQTLRNKLLWGEDKRN
ncbi:MAG: NAD kinase [Bacteroidota bacterium]|nr:NAD kinase [Bacteroidota bacterium]